MKKAQWFSRHTPTPEQLSDAEWLGYEIVGVETGKRLGAVSMETFPDVQAVASDLAEAIFATGAEAIFGVFPSPLRAHWFHADWSAPAELWEAWNVQRTVEGGRPTFEHKAWVRTL